MKSNVIYLHILSVKLLEKLTKPLVICSNFNTTTCHTCHNMRKTKQNKENKEPSLWNPSGTEFHKSNTKDIN